MSRSALVDQALAQVRNLALELRPSMLDDLGLASALRWYVDRQARRAGLAVHFDLPVGPTGLVAEQETVCYRIVQEAVTNVIRHAQAKSLTVAMRRTEKGVQLLVRDDGLGFDVATTRARAVHRGQPGGAGHGGAGHVGRWHAGDPFGTWQWDNRQGELLKQ